MPTPLLILVDVQAGFVNAWTRAMPDRARRLQEQYGRVVATRFVNPEGSMHRRLLGWPRFAPQSAEVDLAFAPAAHVRVIDKTAYTCLVPAVRALIEAEGIDEVHLAGIATDGCVLKTAVDLFEAGIRPVVLAGACASHGGPDCHAAGLMLLRRFIGRAQVVDAAAL